MNEKELVKWYIPGLKEDLLKVVAETDEAVIFEDLIALQHKLKYFAKNLKSDIKKMEVYDAVRYSIEWSTEKDQPE